MVQVKSLKNQTLIADKCYVADRFLERLRGLIGCQEFAPGMGMLFPRCNDIHMWFMSIPIDVVFLRRESGPNGARTFAVSSVRENARPWSLLPFMDFRASDTLELPAGTVRRCSIQVGDLLCIS